MPTRQGAVNTHGLSDVEGLVVNSILRDVLCSDYLVFCEWVFRTIRKGHFIEAAHHRAIAAALGRLERDGNGLVINMPPRFGKTEMAVVLWMAWTFARNPRAQFVHVSSGEDLALRNSGAVKELIEAPEFQAIFPVRLKRETSAKHLWETTAGGGVKAGSAGGVVTGFGAGRMDWKEGDPFDGAVIIDDPLKPGDASSDALRQAVNDNLSQTMRSRRNHPKVPVLIIMQRLHMDDPTQYALDGKMALDFKHLCLKARQDDGTALWPEKLPLETMAIMELADRYTFASQYQQTPIALGGNVFKLEWLRRYDRLPEGRTIHSWDTAYKADQHNDPSCCTVWRIAAGNYYLAEVVHGRFEYPELKRKIIALQERDRPEAVLIEDKASGQSLVQELRQYANIIAIEPEKDKLTRAISCTGAVEAGKIHLPHQAPWLLDYEQELTAFPSAKHDDRVDSTTQFLRHMNDRQPTGYAEMMRTLGYAV